MKSNIIFRSFMCSVFLKVISFIAIAEEKIHQLDDVVIEAGEASRITADTISTIEYVEREEIENFNSINVEDTFKYLPNMNIRKRFIGDPNGVVQIRGTHTWQTARSMVFADGMPLHYHLQTRWNGAPRWNLVSANEVDVVEIVYGPYQAEFSGSAMAGVFNIKTKIPQRKEAAIKGTFFSQDFSYYGVDDSFNGYNSSIYYSDKNGRFDYSLFYVRLENESHPQSFRSDTGSFSAATTETNVSNGFVDTDPRGRNMIVYGDSGSEDIENDLFRLKLGYSINDATRIYTSFAYLQHERESNPNNYLRDATGNPIWGDGKNSTDDAQINGLAFNVRNSHFSIGEHERKDLIWAIGMDSQWKNGWSQKSIFSIFDIKKNEDIDSNFSPSDPLDDGSGSVVDLDGSGWKNLDVKFSREGLLKNENLDFHTGFHWDDFTFNSTEFKSNSWRAASRDTFDESGKGKTSTTAIYAQFDWRLAKLWILNIGGRQEWWNASEGNKTTSTASTLYPDRSIHKFSPKFSLKYNREDWELRYSLARAYRFPIGEELFGTFARLNNVINADPNLKPEKGFHQTLMLNYYLTKGSLRLSLFQDDIDDTIFSQTDVNFTPSVTTFRNIDRVLTRGIDLASSQYGLFKGWLDLNFNVSYQDASIKKNSPNPSLEGNDFPRVPNWRVNSISTLNISEVWKLSTGFRYSSNQFNRIQNDDHGRGWGATDKFFVVDLKTKYTFNKGITGAIGINNLFDEEYFVVHPYPQRTFFVESNWKI